MSWKTKGMNRDMSVSAFNPEFAFENINVRLSTNEGNTTMSWVNERGTKDIILNIEPTCFSDEEKEKLSNEIKTTIQGTPLGTAVLNHQLVIFTHIDEGADDYIYVFKKSNKKGSNGELILDGRILYNHTLNFNIKHPIETIVSFESNDIQKVYWTDNYNQPRVINIASSMDEHTKDYKGFSFDFVPELQLEENVTVKKIFGSGEFAAGVIQYAFTYYNKYGQESNVFHVTPLQYISYSDRAGKPGNKIANSFKITVTNLDKNFDYLRIYSIQRTSLDATPIARRVTDIEITKDTVKNRIYFTDNGLGGEPIDPTELLYKGGEEIKAETMEQKDGTLFLGNVKITRPQLDDIESSSGKIDLKEYLLKVNGLKDDKGNPTEDYPLMSTSKDKDRMKLELKERPFTVISKNPLCYLNTLSCSEDDEYEGASTFKGGEYYRLGLQFQYKNGQWSEPCWIGDVHNTLYPKQIIQIDSEGKKSYDILQYPEFVYTIAKYDSGKDIFKALYGNGYRKVRPVFVVPKMSDRTVLCQGVGCATVYRGEQRTNNNPYAQASWLFRTPVEYKYDGALTCGDAENGGGVVSGVAHKKGGFENSTTAILSSHYEQVPDSTTAANDVFQRSEHDYIISPWLRNTEIMGAFEVETAFHADSSFATINSPDLVFDSSFSSMSFEECGLRDVGYIDLDKTYGDIDIQTSTPPIGADSSGFVHHKIVTNGNAALISGLFYNDHLLHEKDGDYVSFFGGNPPVDFPVFMWHKNGSLNNDINRAGRSADLLKKIISNYKWGDATIYQEASEKKVDDIQLFNNDELSIIKVQGHIYEGNINTLLTPSYMSPFYIVGSPARTQIDTDFYSDSYFKLTSFNDNDNMQHGIFGWEDPNIYHKDHRWVRNGITDDDDSGIGKWARGLLRWKESISMKYKSTPHLVAALTQKNLEAGQNIIYPTQEVTSTKGEKDWSISRYNTLPMLEVTREYKKDTIFGGTTDEALQAATWIPCGPAVSFKGEDQGNLKVYFKWGDTFFQRYDCLKTYPFTSEDKNQVVEIASFMCETRVNLDGRYDRGRGQTSNLYATPENYNLINPVYSQMDNFFNYKILSKEYYNNTDYPNVVTWTKTKTNGADVDLWTNITMANTLELDGDKGEITKLTRLNNQLLAFQDSGISQILYNENTQISTTEGVPIEIANSQKVQGKRYLSDTVGCSNKWSMTQTPYGIYFMDSNEKSIYLFSGQLKNLSTTGGFNSWAKQHIPSAEVKWNPRDFGNFITHYDKLNQEVLFVNKETALAYSEKFGCFTSFYDYGGVPFFDNFDDIGIWACIDGETTKLYQHQAGEYCKFFGNNKPFSMTLVANQEPQMDKIFTNLEFRACVDGDGDYNSSKDRFTAYLPLDSVEVWDEYQHGILTLSNRNTSSSATREPLSPHGGTKGILSRKFRMWRCDIPRDNAPIDKDVEKLLGISRLSDKPRALDRIRNPWMYMKLKKDAPTDNTKSLPKTEIHDILVTYFG